MESTEDISYLFSVATSSLKKKFIVKISLIIKLSTRYLISELRKSVWNWAAIEYVTSEQDLGSGTVSRILTIW